MNKNNAPFLRASMKVTKFNVVNLSKQKKGPNPAVCVHRQMVVSKKLGI